MKLIFMAVIMACAPALSQAGDSPDEAYRDAARVLSDARQAWHEKNSDLAWQRLLEAKKLFGAIRRDHPGWNPEAVAAQLKVCTDGSEKTAPRIVRELDQSIHELKKFSASMDELKTRKLSALQQADWEYNFIHDRIEKLVLDYARRQAGVPGGAEVAEVEEPTAEEEEWDAALEEAGLTAAGIAPGLDSDDDGLTDGV